MGAVTCYLLARIFAGDAAALEIVVYGLTAADRVLAELPSDIQVRMVDCHAEATSDKQLMGRYLDGRVSAVLCEVAHHERKLPAQLRPSTRRRQETDGPRQQPDRR